VQKSCCTALHWETNCKAYFREIGPTRDKGPKMFEGAGRKMLCSAQQPPLFIL
jgi:hypothetical protein